MQKPMYIKFVHSITEIFRREDSESWAVYAWPALTAKEATVPSKQHINTAPTLSNEPQNTPLFVSPCLFCFHITGHVIML